MTDRPTEDEIVEIGARAMHDHGIERGPWEARNERTRQAYREGMQRVLAVLSERGLVVVDIGRLERIHRRSRPLPDEFQDTVEDLRRDLRHIHADVNAMLPAPPATGGDHD